MSSTATDTDTDTMGDALPGFVIDGALPEDNARGAPCGDVNGDGLDDLVINTYGGRPAYVVFGKADTAAVKLADIEDGGAGGRTIRNTLDPTCDVEVVGVGDLNGDGFADLAVAALRSFDPCSSRVLVLLGEPDGSGAIDLDPALANVVALDSPDWSLDGPRGVGDVNGDGFDDLSVREGSLFVGGTSHVFFGGSPLESRTTVELASDQGGVTIGPWLDGDIGAIRGSGVGDVNGDGVDDLLVAKTSAPYDTSQYARVLFGGADLAADGPGYEIALDDAWGVRVAGGRDINDDGRADFTIDYNYNMEFSYVLFGKADAAPIDLREGGDMGPGFTVALSGVEGWRTIVGPDVSGDGRAELMITVDADYFGDPPAIATMIFGKDDAAPIAVDALPEGAGVHLHAGPLGAYLGDVTGWANVAGSPTYDLVIADEDAGDPLTGGRTYVLFDMGGGVP